MSNLVFMLGVKTKEVENNIVRIREFKGDYALDKNDWLQGNIVHSVHVTDNKLVLSDIIEYAKQVPEFNILHIYVPDFDEKREKLHLPKDMDFGVPDNIREFITNNFALGVRIKNGEALILSNDVLAHILSEYISMTEGYAVKSVSVNTNKNDYKGIFENVKDYLRQTPYEMSLMTMEGLFKIILLNISSEPKLRNQFPYTIALDVFTFVFEDMKKQMTELDTEEERKKIEAEIIANTEPNPDIINKEAALKDKMISLSPLMIIIDHKKVTASVIDDKHSVDDTIKYYKKLLHENHSLDIVITYLNTDGFPGKIHDYLIMKALGDKVISPYELNMDKKGNIKVTQQMLMRLIKKYGQRSVHINRKEIRFLNSSKEIASYI